MSSRYGNAIQSLMLRDIGIVIGNFLALAAILANSIPGTRYHSKGLVLMAY